MLILSTYTAIAALLFMLAVPGRSIFEKFGHGKVAPSRLNYPVPCRGTDWQ